MGGGVCIYVRDSEIFVPLEIKHHPDYFESVWLFLPQHSILFTCVYLPPIPSICRTVDFENFITNTADEFMNEGYGQNLIVCGDFNKFSVVSLCDNNDLTPLVKLPTRGGNILDNVLASEQLTCHYSCTVGPPIASSDHNSILCSSQSVLESSSSNLPVNKFYDLRFSNVESFLYVLSVVNWGELYNMAYSVNEKCEILRETIKLCIEQTIPTVFVQSSKNDKPWMTPMIKHLINLRWAAFRNKRFIIYDNLKRKIKVEINKAKMKWGLRAKQSPRDLWRVVNIATGRNKNKLDHVVQKFSNIESAANAINTNFVSVFTPANETVSVEDVSSSNEDLRPISALIVFDVIRRLRQDKATGPEDIPAVLYKRAAALLAEPLTHIFNVCLAQGFFPTAWKLATVVPVPKTSKPSITDLRPISLLSTLSKVFERILAKAVHHHFLRSSGGDQHGGLPGRSTVTASILIHDHITRLLDLDDVVAVQVIAYDMSKAFDKLPHSTILKRLIDCDFPSNFVKLIQSYLFERFQQVQLNQYLSNVEMVSSGVPQGSVLGPLLFISVMGSLHALFPDTVLVKFIDDLTVIVPVYRHGSSHAAEEDHNIRSWTNKVGLTLNVEKSKCLVFKKSATHVLIHLPDVEFVETHRILGVLWSDNLDWSPHFNTVSRTFSSRLHCLRILKGFLNANDLWNVYKCLLLPLLEYCSPLFIGMPKRICDRLEKLQRRAHSIICGRDCTCKNIEALSTRRLARGYAVLNQMLSPSHPLNNLLPPKSVRSSRLILPHWKSKRRQTSFVPFMVLHSTGHIT